LGPFAGEVTLAIARVVEKSPSAGAGNPGAPISVFWTKSQQTVPDGTEEEHA